MHLIARCLGRIMNPLIQKRLWVISLFLFMAVPSIGSAQLSDIGVVINETHTPVGEEFYRIFTQYWPGHEKYNIIISEESGRWGSIIKIVVDENILYISPRLNYAEIEGEVNTAIDSVEQLILGKKEFSE